VETVRCAQSWVNCGVRVALSNTRLVIPEWFDGLEDGSRAEPGKAMKTGAEMWRREVVALSETRLATVEILLNRWSSSAVRGFCLQATSRAMAILGGLGRPARQAPAGGGGSGQGRVSIALGPHLPGRAAKSTRLQRWRIAGRSPALIGSSRPMMILGPSLVPSWPLLLDQSFPYVYPASSRPSKRPAFHPTSVIIPALLSTDRYSHLYCIVLLASSAG
jgi:hypothetical protein